MSDQIEDRMRYDIEMTTYYIKRGKLNYNPYNKTLSSNNIIGI